MIPIPVDMMGNRYFMEYLGAILIMFLNMYVTNRYIPIDSTHIIKVGFIFPRRYMPESMLHTNRNIIQLIPPKVYSMNVPIHMVNIAYANT